MAVAENQQGKGLGKLVMQYMEEKARENGASEVILQARKNAVDFYRSCGYEVVEKSHLLWGKIQHYLMRKSI
jgi:N-acetylglutamate synthase-like GNAT family acetyltransferase